MSKYSSGDFITAFNTDKMNVGAIIESLDLIIVRIVNSLYNKYKKKIRDASIGVEDVMQDVRIYLVEKIPDLMERTVLSGEEVYRYITTLIKRETFRILIEIVYTNPRVKERRKLKPVNVSLSRINLEFFEYTASYPIENLVNLYRERCQRIPNAVTILDFITSDKDSTDFAGLDPDIYAFTVKKMRQLAADMNDEVSYE
jgi:hypothetical protein